MNKTWGLCSKLISLYLLFFVLPPLFRLTHIDWIDSFIVSQSHACMKVSVSVHSRSKRLLCICYSSNCRINQLINWLAFEIDPCQQIHWNNVSISFILLLIRLKIKGNPSIFLFHHPPFHSVFWRTFISMYAFHFPFLPKWLVSTPQFIHLLAKQLMKC